VKMVTTVGIDLAKNSFEIVGVNNNCQVIKRARLKRSQVRIFFENLPRCKVAMEACGGSHYWARVFRSQGHEVKVIAAQFVKPFLKSQKNDRNDALAIVEASLRPSMNFVSVKEVWQQDLQCLHRVRQGVQNQRVQVTNQIRSLLLEYGVAIPEGMTSLYRELPAILESADSEVSDILRQLVSDLYLDLKRLDERKIKLDESIKALANDSEDCQRLMSVPGVGPLIATAFVAAVGDPRTFKNGRQVGAWLGLVPRQHSSGDRQVLSGITKRGDIYLRAILTHGARSVVAHSKRGRTKNQLYEWVRQLEERRGTNRTTIALANRNARVMWAMMKNKTIYKVA
jgi:transposase